MEQARPSGKVCVVASSSAWSFYRLASAYLCQPGRSLQDARWLGFYSSGAIQPAVARIDRIFSPVELSADLAAEWSLSTDPLRRRAGDAAAAALFDGRGPESVQIVVLSRPDEPATIPIPEIPHRGAAAWTLFQRFVPLDRLLSATTTDDLAEAGAAHG
jgi:hypothetical protein